LARLQFRLQLIRDESTQLYNVRIY